MEVSLTIREIVGLAVVGYILGVISATLVYIHLAGMGSGFARSLRQSPCPDRYK